MVAPGKQSGLWRCYRCFDLEAVSWSLAIAIERPAYAAPTTFESTLFRLSIYKLRCILPTRTAQEACTYAFGRPIVPLAPSTIFLKRIINWRLNILLWVSSFWFHTGYVFESDLPSLFTYSSCGINWILGWSIWHWTTSRYSRAGLPVTILSSVYLVWSPQFSKTIV